MPHRHWSGVLWSSDVGFVNTLFGVIPGMPCTANREREKAKNCDALWPAGFVSGLLLHKAPLKAVDNIVYFF